MKPKVLQWPTNGLTPNLISSHLPCAHSSHTGLLAVLQTTAPDMCGSVHLERKLFSKYFTSHPLSHPLFPDLILLFFRAFLQDIDHAFWLPSIFLAFFPGVGKPIYPKEKNSAVGLIVSPKFHVHPELQKVTSVGNRFFATVISYGS